MKKRISSNFHQHVVEGVANSVEYYLSLSPDKRHEMETKGINLATHISNQLIPLIQNMKIGSLLIVMEEGIGNMVMLTPALRLLRHNNPRLQVTVWGREPSVQVIKGWDVVDNVITEFDDNFYDLVVFTIWSSNIKSKYHEYLQNYCKGFYEVSMDIPYHEAIYHNSINSFLDATNELTDTHCELAKGNDLTEIVAKMINFKLLETVASSEKYEGSVQKYSKYIVFGDNANHLPEWNCKKWPYYKELAELINKKFPEYTILMIGDEKDKEEFSKITWPNNTLLDFCGINIPQLAYLLKHAEFYVGNDCGASHIAASVGTKTFVIFAPTLLSKNKPLGKDVHIIKQYLPCSPCQYTTNWGRCECMTRMDANYVYNRIFYPEDNKGKEKILLVGSWAPNYHRNERNVKMSLEKDFGMKVITFDFRDVASKLGELKATTVLSNMAIEQGCSKILVMGGAGIAPDIFYNLQKISPEIETFLWYADFRGQTEPWFVHAASFFDNVFWTVGSPELTSKVFGKLQKPCEFLPITPDQRLFYPKDVEKKYDVIFAGMPHSKQRINLCRALIKNGINLTIFGDGNWPDDLKSCTKPGVFNDAFNEVLNQAKIVVNTNMFNNTPYYFSDRYFYPLATKVVGVNQYIPGLETIFEDKKQMMFFRTDEEAVQIIKDLLANPDKMKEIAEDGYEFYLQNYTTTHMLQRMFNFYENMAKKVVDKVVENKNV